ncbi:MAG: ABC transporter permease [Lachnospiraceae bacterium]
MLCICKREIRSFFHSMIGWVFGAFLLLMAGIYFTAYNLNYGYPLFSYTLSSITFLFLIVSPILAMRTLAEERKQKTDQLLLTAPVTVWQIVLGKYLALIVTFLLPVVILCFYPLIMAQCEALLLHLLTWHCLVFFCLDVPAWLWDCSSRLLRKARFLPQSEPSLFCWYVI